MVEWCGDAFQQFCCVGQAIAVPIIISPVEDSVVIVVKSRLFFAPETSWKEFLVNVQPSVVIVIRVFSVRDSIVVVVNVVNTWAAKTLGQNSSVPHRLEESIVVCVRVVTVVIVIHTVCSLEEIAVVLSSIVVQVEVGINFKEIPDTIVIVVNIVPVVDCVVIVVQIYG